MPTYKGLEKYKLVEKMGECVSSIGNLSSTSANVCLAYSGAFSNVYKAIDTQTGQKVAGAMFG